MKSLLSNPAAHKDPTPRAGAHLRADRGLYWHHGIDMGDGTVVHFTGEPFERVNAAVRRTPFERFANGCPVSVVNHGPDLAAADICERARCHLGRSDYHLLFNNCEHFATWCVTGHRRSRQVDRTAWRMALVGGSLRAATWIAKKRLAPLVASRAVAGLGPVGTGLAVAGLAVAVWNRRPARQQAATASL